ncbi:MAG TPA: hypothetical protein VGG61_08190 [Gemmataceae bacterium]
MSAGPDPQVEKSLLEQTRKQVNRLFEEVGRLTELDVKPAEFYAEFLNRILSGLMAPAGAVWVCTAQGNLQLQHQINLRQVALEGGDKGKQMHDELLRQALRGAKPIAIPPHSSTGNPEGGPAAAGNPSSYLILLAPVVVDDQVTALVEVWQRAERHPDAAGGFLKFLTDMARLASLYARNYQRRQMTGQQQLWLQLETFSRKIHGSLNPTEVSYVIANEGRRLIDCDRVSVALFQGRKTRIEAVSGADVVEKRSNLVKLMRKLCSRVARWGEKLVYTGTKDDTLPPKVMDALDKYLAESNSKLLVVVPLRDEREKNVKKRPRSALLMECFEPPAAAEQLLARLDVIGQHATTALYNAVEYRRIPMRFVWKPMANVQEGLGGKARLITLSVVAGVALLATLLYVVPFPLKMEAKGELRPEIQRFVCAPHAGEVKMFTVKPGDTVSENQELAILTDAELALKLTDLANQIKNAQDERSQLQQSQGGQGEFDRKIKSSGLESKFNQLDGQRIYLMESTNSDKENPGRFKLLAPKFPPETTLPQEQRVWTVLNSDFRENFTGKGVKPSDQLIRLGNKAGPWEVELKIPQKHAGQVLQAFDYLHKEELDVDLLVRSDPTHTYQGKLKRFSIGGEAVPQKDDNNESEPVVSARVRIEGADIPEANQIPRDMLLTGTEVRAKIRCGNHRMGYSLFYGVYEFFYEKVVFFF